MEPLIKYDAFIIDMTVYFQIKEQITLPYEYTFLPKDRKKYLAITTAYGPELTESFIFLRGLDRERDFNVVTIAFKHKKDAEEYLDKLNRSIRHWVCNYRSNR